MTKMRNTLVTMVLLLASLSVSAQVSYSRYDVNNDHEVNVTDVTKLVNIILGAETSTRGDVNGDKAVNVNDVTALVDYILGKRVINGHEFVDLGLPSGTLWATQNMGASTPEEYGDYYAWGELEPKEVYKWTTYSLCDGSSESLNKYCDNASYGKVDNKTVLALDDDAAHVNWGGLWCMPSKAQAQELKNKCTWVLDKTRALYTVTGPNGNSITMPLAGYRQGTGTYLMGECGYYWTTSLATNYPIASYTLACDQALFEINSLRNSGRSIRPVAK